MKPTIIIGVLFFLTLGQLECSRRTASPVAATRTAPATAPSIDSAAIESVMIFPPPAPSWFLTVVPDGGASIQYGSTFGDSARLPPGTLDFREIVDEVVRQHSAVAVRDGTSARLKLKGSQSTTSYSLKYDDYFRKLIASVSDRWIDKGWRFDELLEKYPIYPNATEGATP